MSYLLAIDIGNSNLTIGLLKDNEIKHQWRMMTNRDRTSDEYGIEMEQMLRHFKIGIDEIEDVIISSVVPNLMYSFPTMCRHYLHKEPIIVGAGTKTGMNIRYDNPKEVGADRIVNAVAAYEKYGGPLIIIDLGTAITHDVVSANGEYLGGAIAPGIGISTDALFMRTAKLPKIELVDPNRAIGKTTVESMQSGIVYGYIGMIDGVTEHIITELGVDKRDVRVIATGGFAQLISLKSKYVEKVDKDLTLNGLQIIYNRTKKHEAMHP